MAKANQPAPTTRVNKRGQTVPVKNQPNKPQAVPQQSQPQINNTVYQGGQDWNNWAHQNANDAINYGQNNQWTNMAQPWMQNQLNGDMSNNPWMSGLYNDLQGQNLNETNDLIRKFLGVDSGGAGGVGGGGGGGTQIRYINQGGGGGGAVSGQGGGGGGSVPDTVGGNNSYFAQQVREMFDPARLDPANDPTMQPFIEALRRENSQNLYASMQDLAAQAEGSGRFGSGLYQAMTGNAREQSMESLDQQMANAMLQTREANLARQMQGLQDINTRDIAAMQDATQRYGIDASASAAGAGAAAQAKAQELQAIGMLMNNAQFGMGQRGDMAQLMQQGQLGALNAAQGFAGQGLQGYGIGNQLANTGLQGLGLISSHNLGLQGAAAAMKNANANALGARAQMFGAQDNAAQNSLNSLMNIMNMMGGMGGSAYGSGQFVPNGGNANTNAILAGLGQYFGSRG